MDDLFLGVNAISAGTTRGNGEIVLSNSNGLTFGLNGQTVTGSYTVPSVTNSSWTVSDNATSGTVGRLAFTNLNGVTLSLSSGTGGLHTIVGSHNALTSQSNQNVTAGNGGFAFQTLSFSNANGFSFGTSAGSAITGSYTVPTVTNSSLTLSDNATSMTIGRLAFSQSNGLTLSLSTTTGGSATLVGSYTVPTVTNSSWTVSDNGTSGSVARLAFTNLNGVTLSLSTGAGGSHTIVGSHNALTSQSNQAFSAAGGSSAFQTLGFSDNAHGSFTNTNGSVALQPIKMSLYAVSNTTQSSSGTQNLSALSFAGAGGASVGVTNGSVVVSVPTGGGGTTNQTGPNIGVSNLGNTAGSTGTVSTGDVVLVGSNGITLSQSTAAAGSHATITILGERALTISKWPPLGLGLSVSSAYSGATTTTAGGSRTTYTLYLSPMVLENHLTFNTVGWMVTHSTVAGTASFTNALMVGLYTLNAGTALSRLSNFHFEVRRSQNSVTAQSMYWFWGTNSTSNSSSIGGNVSATIHRGHHVMLSSGGASLSKGHYWLGYINTISTVGSNIGYVSGYHVSLTQTSVGSMFGTNVSSQAWAWHGPVSGTITSNAANVNIMPASVHTSAITMTGGSSNQRSNFLMFASVG